MPTNLKHQRDFPKVQVHFQFVSAVLKPHEITIISLMKEWHRKNTCLYSISKWNQIFK